MGGSLFFTGSFSLPVRHLVVVGIYYITSSAINRLKMESLRDKTFAQTVNSNPCTMNVTCRPTLLHVLRYLLLSVYGERSS